MKPVKSKSYKKAATQNSEDMHASYELLEVVTLTECQEERKSFYEAEKPWLYSVPNSVPWLEKNLR